MNRDDFISAITAIGTCEDETERRTQLATLQNEMCDFFDNVNTLSSANETLTNENEKLRRANTELFLQIGTKHQQIDNDEQETEKRKFEDLFNEKGELK